MTNTSRPDYRPTVRSITLSDITVSAEWQYTSRRTRPDGSIDLTARLTGGEGAFLGYAAHAYGAYLPGGNPVYQGPIRATYAEALADSLGDVAMVCTGYLCG